MAEEIKKATLSLSVDDGYQRVPITNKYGDEIGVFYFNPTDIGIIERYNKMADNFESITEPLEAITGDDKGESDVLDKHFTDAITEATERLYAAVNELFATDAAEAFFGRTNPFSPVDGKFYCEAVLQMLGQFISEQFDAETKKMSARVSKYTANRAQRRAKK